MFKFEDYEQLIDEKKRVKIHEELRIHNNFWKTLKRNIERYKHTLKNLAKR